jgi:hypothetical protein
LPALFFLENNQLSIGFVFKKELHLGLNHLYYQPVQQIMYLKNDILFYLSYPMKNTLLCVLIFTCFYSKGQTPTVGLLSNHLGNLDGYFLFSAVNSKDIFMINSCDKSVHKWEAINTPGLSEYFRPDGSLLRAGNSLNPVFLNGGEGGLIQSLAWDGTVLWSYTISDSMQCQHHDILTLPNGNVLALVWERKSKAEAIAAGRDSTQVDQRGLWFNKVVELQPIGADSAKIVWQWKEFDHLTQSFDNSKANYHANTSDPGLLHLNYRTYPGPDWVHMNALDYNPAFDQIMLSSRNLDEIYVIDHSTTMTEASLHSGGNYGKGGDFLYRWGNADSYGMGSIANHQLYGQHNPQWIKPGLPHEGEIILFDNGNGRPGGNYTSIIRIVPPVDGAGNYSPSLPFGPAVHTEVYVDSIPARFYSAFIGGVQQLPDDQVLVCNGMSGDFFVSDSSTRKTWEYICPSNQFGTMSQGSTPNNNSTFRCTFYPSNYSGFNGKSFDLPQAIESGALTYSCDLITGVVNESDESVFSAYPNPVTDGIVNVNTTADKFTVRLYDVHGKIQLESRNNKHISTAGISDGLYILCLQTESGKVFRKKLIVSGK